MPLRFLVLLSLIAASIAVFGSTSPVSAAGKKCFGQSGNVTPSGGIYYLTAGNDVVVGTSGADLVDSSATGGTDYICTGAGSDYISIAISSSTMIDAGSGVDLVIVSGAGALSVWAGSGDDTVNIAVNSAAIDSGSGNDYVYVTGEGTTIHSGTGQDTITDIGVAVLLDCGSNYDSYASTAPVIRRCELELVILNP